MKDVFTECPRCRGNGKEIGPSAYVNEVRQPCKRCDGRGLVPIEHVLLFDAVRKAIEAWMPAGRMTECMAGDVVRAIQEIGDD